MGLNMTEEEFAKLSWNDQYLVMRNLDNAASDCSGKTKAIADKKRAPLIALEDKFRAIHAKQKLKWITSKHKNSVGQNQNLFKSLIKITNLLHKIFVTFMSYG